MKKNQKKRGVKKGCVFSGMLNVFDDRGGVFEIEVAREAKEPWQMVW